MYTPLLFYSRPLAISIYLFSIGYATRYPNPINYQPWGPLKYMTFWNVVLQTTYLLFSFVAQNVLVQDSLTSTVDLWFFSLTFPIALFVGAVFWGLYAINRELIFPKTHDQYVPRWSTHVKHTLIVFMVLLELICGNHTIPEYSDGLKLLLAFLGAYFVMVLYLAYRHKFWVYPILAKLNWPSRFIFFAVLTSLKCVLFMFGVESKRLLDQVEF